MHADAGAKDRWNMTGTASSRHVLFLGLTLHFLVFRSTFARQKDPGFAQWPSSTIELGHCARTKSFCLANPHPPRIVQRQPDRTVTACTLSAAPQPHSAHPRPPRHTLGLDWASVGLFLNGIRKYSLFDPNACPTPP